MFEARGALMPHPMRLAIETTLAWLFETRCVACRTRGPLAVCAACQARIETASGPRCARCDHPLVRDGAACPDCRRIGAPAFEATVAVGRYSGMLRDLVLALKYRDGWRVADVLASRMAERVRQRGFGVDLVVPVPVDASRKANRGYSQSVLLASRVAVRLGLPHRADLLWRRVDGVVQSTANRETRHAQLAGVFEAAEEVRGRRVLLVDDVCTTASTLNAAAQALREHGARVWGVVAARQMLHGGRR
ncbi:MAG: ComF family protein [Proteobacteria bacterium]|nr:ComF family protein [Pseudomonadota bacterium]